MKVALIDYNMGNLGSVVNALGALGAEVEILSVPDKLMEFDRCILPGVGSFGDGMRNLREAGFDVELKKFAASDKRLLGICLGMQMMLEGSEESPGVEGLGIFPGQVIKFPVGRRYKVPQIGWNMAEFSADCLLGRGLPQEAWFYFVHSYYVPLSSFTAAESEYIVPFSAAIGKNNCFATQFHPEKSQSCGLKLLENFIS